MAAIGMKYVYAVPITSRTSGQAISYATSGFSVGHGVSANISFNLGDNKDYGDDVAVDTDNGITGFNVDFETNDLSPTVRASLLGLVPDASTPTEYGITDDVGPEVGFGFVRHLRIDGVDHWDCWFMDCVRFTQNNISAATKEENIAWQHENINGIGVGVYIDSSGKASFGHYMRFDTDTAAHTWIKGKCKIT